MASFLLIDTNERIIDISIQLGYESQSTFTRAFKNHFKVTPNQYRVNKNDLVMLTKTQISMENITKNNYGNFQVIDMEELKLIGLSYTTYENTENYDISVPHIRDTFYYKLCDCSYIPKFHRCFDYSKKSSLSTTDINAWDTFIGIDFNKYTPQDLETKIIPKSKYLCFTHYGELNKLGESIEKIWNNYLPIADYDINYDYSLTLYNHEVLGEYFYPGKPMKRIKYNRDNDIRFSHNYVVKILIPIK